MKKLTAFAAVALVSACVSSHPAMSDAQASRVATPKSSAEQILDAIAEDYIKLTLAMGEKESGYVDAYYGPPEWTQAAKNDPRDMVELGNDIVRLMEPDSEDQIN